jgi:hypothetical protein
MFGDSGLFTDVSEGPVAIIVEEPTRTRLEDSRNAIVADPVFVDAAPGVLVELGKLADEEVQAAVAVVVEPDSAGVPSRSGYARFLRDISECAIAVVVVQDASSNLGDIQIRETVTVVITDCYPHAITAAGDAGFFRDVGECTVAVVPIERVAQRPRRIVKLRLTAVDEVNVHPAIVVVIEKSTTGTARFGQVLLA